ncbi:uncharacterized protein LOC135498383 [Lineus longissimus]|uniref:uncharacterized protein LOC135498383 n=1 Tax=Lineus longissimus TaxID=88925 RepID=UPI00315DA488
MEKVNTLRQNRDLLQRTFEETYQDAEEIMEQEMPTKLELSRLEACLKMRTESWDATPVLNEEIDKAVVKLKDDALREDEVMTTNKRNIDIKTKLIHVKNHVGALKTPKTPDPAPTVGTTATKNSPLKSAQLPKLKLPTFDGTYTKWKAFWDTIEADVIKANYADITKFNYISGQLTGTAKESAVGLHAAGNNLQTLIDLLTERLKPQKPRTVLTACNTEDNAMDCFREDSQIDQLENFLRANVLSDTGMTDMDYEDNIKEKYMERIQFRDGHYYVPLPWRPDHPELQNNYNTCKGRINQVMHRLRKLNLVQAYVNVMKENISKGYVSEVTTAPTSRLDEGFFLPHFPVLRESETTPLRIVFDASCGSPSLNSCLYEGPNMIQDLTELLHLFRTKKIAISADIARAFLSVRLLESERKFVKFLWYKDNDVTKGLVPYHCNTVIFGNVSSPFALAITLYKHLSAFDGKEAEDMKEKLYVDNLLTGVTDEAEALECYTQSRDIMNKGSFLLRQWSSNSLKLSAVAESDGPLHVPAKSFVNQLWQAGKDWDDKLSLAENEQWSKVQVSLSRAHEIKIQRWLVVDTTKPLDTIIFCDACPTTAVGCVAYAKQGTRVGLIGSKNKIVSQKNAKQTVPKLELMAMVMGAQYGEILRKTYAKECFTIDITYATDSEIALYSLQSEKKLTPFVMNRVNVIREKSDSNKWYHVATKENSADILSRGATYEELQSSTWETGPVWLKQDKCEWPCVDVRDKPTNIRISLAASLEIDNIFQTRDAGNTSTRPDLQAVIDISKFSSYQKLLRVTALVTRAFKPGIRERNKLSAVDIAKVERTWITHTQRAHYSPVLDYLNKEKQKLPLPKRPSIINQLGLLIDEDNIIRCGGRIRNADVNTARKYPMLLPGTPVTSHLTSLIITHAHHTATHYGVGITMAGLRERFWITSMRSVVKKVINRCVVCKLVAGRPYLQPKAPQLPEFRLNDIVPYLSTAIDFTAHLYVKVRNQDHVKIKDAHRKTYTVQKAYVCLFTCCTTRAVHLEITPDLTVGSFLRVFRRFTSTHSVPKLVYCDNAKTFTCADKELKRLYQNVAGEECQRQFANKRISFKYAPVQASWFAGVHERLIGVSKLATKKVLGKALVPMDELQTVVKEIQSVINNRPLTYLSSDSHELKAITPNCLIYGHERYILPQEEVEIGDDFDTTYGGRDAIEKWAHKRALLLKAFRTRFYDEYLAALRQQHTYETRKQYATGDVIREGDVILVHEKDQPRIKWKLGVVEERHCGPDGLTRSATVTLPTHKHGHTLDLVIVRDEDRIVNDVTVCSHELSDHFTIGMVLSLSKVNVELVKSYRKYRSVSPKELGSEICAEFAKCKPRKSVNETAETLNNAIVSTLDRKAPLKHNV